MVGLAPDGRSSYDWVSTFNGPQEGGLLSGFSGTNGSMLSSDPFFASAGSTVSFWFNYATSDGAEYADYAWSQLRSATSIVTLFSARTLPAGNIVPGADLPSVFATLSPASVEIQGGAPVWSPLGPSSGRCYGAGCGLTGWIQSSYTIQEVGTYTLNFGVSNFLDSAYDSGMAFSGLLLNGAVIGDGGAPDNPLLPGEIAPDGGFIFSFTPTPATPFFIDPLVAIGYDYQILSGSNAITQAIFPVLAGDADGYQIYALGDTSPAGLLGTVVGGETFTFSAAVQGFSLRGIAEVALVDPSNPAGFVTGLTFASGDAITMSQTPFTIDVPAVPEPRAWALMLCGLAVIGTRRRSITGYC